MATAVQYRKWLLVAALSWALLGCFQGLAIDKLANKRMGKAAYHLLRHFSELLIGCALAFPYATALSEKMQKVCFVCLQIAPLSNFLSYMVIAITDCPNELFKNSPELVKAGTGAGNIWTTISTLGLTVVTSSVVVIGLLSLIYGIAKADSDDDVSSSGSKTRGKTPMKKNYNITSPGLLFAEPKSKCNRRDYVSDTTIEKHKSFHFTHDYRCVTVSVSASDKVRMRFAPGCTAASTTASSSREIVDNIQRIAFYVYRNKNYKTTCFTYRNEH